MVVTAADLKDVKKITPMLHKFNYKPVGQPVLADGVVRFIGEPVAAVVAASEEEPRILSIGSNCRSMKYPPVLTRQTRSRLAHHRCTRKRRATSFLRARNGQNSRLRRDLEQCAQDRQSRRAIPAAKCNPNGAARRRRRLRRGDEPSDADCARLKCRTLPAPQFAMRRGIPESDLRVIAPDVGGGFGQKMSLASEYVVLV